MPLRPDQLTRLELHPKSIQALLEDAGDETVLVARPLPEKWSALENLAHLARYHQVFMSRLDQMLEADAQPFPRYKAEQDPQWPQWQAMGLSEVMAQFRQLRSEMTQRLVHLSPGQVARTGIHPAFGAVDVEMMLEMFVLHEGHHLYVMFQRIREQR